MRFIENYPIDQITPADYNPRKIKENAFEKLQESLLKFGVCKAVIANLDGTIVAGHQRTKAMKAVGINHCPIFILEKNVSLVILLSMLIMADRNSLQLRLLYLA